jgi:hypothetical protein
MKKLTAAILGMVIASAACGGGASIVTGPDLLDYLGSSQITGANPMRFSSKVVITNTTTESITFTPACPIPRTLVYSTSARTGTPIWDSKVRDAATSCAASTPVTLNAGKTVTYTLNATGAEVLGTTGTPGTYYLVNEVTLDGVPYRVSGGDIALAR